jgi:hypothetical protein
MNLANEQWQRVKDFIPKPKAIPGKPGRPPTMAFLSFSDKTMYFKNNAILSYVATG